MWDMVVKWGRRRSGVRMDLVGTGLGCFLLGRVCTGMAKMKLGEE